jgi:hypothetical protein
MIRKQSVIFALAFMLAPMLAQQSQANIGINFRRGTGQTEMPIDDSAGVEPQISWNNTSGATSGNNTNIASPTAGVLSDHFGDPTAVTVTWTANTTWSTSSAGSPDARLMSGYIDNTNVRTPTRVDVSNIPYAHYDVIAYVGADQNNRLGHVGILGRGGAYYRTNSHPFTPPYTTNPTPTNANVMAHYIAFTGLSEPSFALLNTRLSNNVGLHGLQIIERDTPAPPPPMPVGLELLAYYSLNGAATDDTDAGTNDATLSGDATFGPGRVGQAMFLDGTRDFAQVIAPTANLKPTDEIALSAWVKNEENNSQGEVLSLGDHYGLRVQADGTVRFLVDYRPDANGWLDPTTSVAIATERVINDGLWHHIVGQKTATGVEIYIDGVRAASAGASFPAIVPIDYNGLGQSLFLGAHGNASTAFDWQGGIDEVRIFRGSLSPENIRGLFENNVVPEPSAVALMVVGGLFAGGYSLRRRIRTA